MPPRCHWPTTRSTPWSRSSCSSTCRSRSRCWQSWPGSSGRGGRCSSRYRRRSRVHDEHDFWRFTAEGLERLCSEFFPGGRVEVFGGTFEALGYLGFYYLSLVLHRVGIKGRALADALPATGHWLDEHNSWSTSTSALHTLAFDLLFVGKAS